jgi:hypothetical protein
MVLSPSTGFRNRLPESDYESDSCALAHDVARYGRKLVLPSAAAGPELAAVVTTRPTLPPAHRAGIVAMIEAASNDWVR